MVQLLALVPDFHPWRFELEFLSKPVILWAPLQTKERKKTAGRREEKAEGRERKKGINGEKTIKRKKDLKKKFKKRGGGAGGGEEGVINTQRKRQEPEQCRQRYENDSYLTAYTWRLARMSQLVWVESCSIDGSVISEQQPDEKTVKCPLQ